MFCNYRMAFTWIYFVAGASMLKAVVGNSEHLHISSHNGKHIVMEGHNITLGCTVEGNQFNPFFNPIIWYKISDDGQTTTQINTATVIMPPFTETGRYSIDPSMEDTPHKRVFMPLSIKEVTLAENGTYRCELRDREKILSSVNYRLVVPAPVQHLNFSGDGLEDYGADKDSHNGVLAFSENQPTYVACHVRGGNPKPLVHIYLANKDITEQFKRTERVIVEGKVGLQYIIHDIMLSSSDLSLSADARGETFKCTTRMTRFPKLKRTESRVVEVKYAPKLSCPSTRYVDTDIENSTTITCTLDSNPPISAKDIQWLFTVAHPVLVAVLVEAATEVTTTTTAATASSSQEATNATTTNATESNVKPTDAPEPQFTMSNVSLPADGSLEGYYSTATVDEETGHLRIELRVDSFMDVSFQHYRLQASNELGRSVASVQLTKDLTTEKVPKPIKVDDNDIYKINNNNDEVVGGPASLESKSSRLSFCDVTLSLAGLLSIVRAAMM